MIAAKRFRDYISFADQGCKRIEVVLHGSLAWTGKGHGTDRAICLGLLGEKPDTVNSEDIPKLLAQLASCRYLSLKSNREVAFDPAVSIISEKQINLPRHSNAMRFHALSANNELLFEQTFYSIGGGFIVGDEDDEFVESNAKVTYPFRRASHLLQVCSETGLSIAELQLANERCFKPAHTIRKGLDAIRSAMFECINRGMTSDGELPGGLNVRRRAPNLRRQLLATDQRNAGLPHERLDWVSLYAIAVNEENAAGGRIVTAPTNGAAGVVPAVLRYYQEFYPDYTEEASRTFLLTAAAVGSLIKANASISGAEVGCQGEVGSAAAMAAAGLTAVSGGTPAQVENAAEIALEHHLGMTCDPIGGLVQIPCIERNAIGAHKAIAAASLALRGDGNHRVSLDEVIETMRQTGADMRDKYKETSLGGLAVNVSEC